MNTSSTLHQFQNHKIQLFFTHTSYPLEFTINFNRILFGQYTIESLIYIFRNWSKQNHLSNAIIIFPKSEIHPITKIPCFSTYDNSKTKRCFFFQLNFVVERMIGQMRHSGWGIDREIHF